MTPPRAPAAPLRWAKLIAGLLGFAVGVTGMIRSGIGLGPWDAFHVGLHLQTGMSIGVASIVTGLAIVALSLAIGVRPGPGTVANMVLIGVFIDLLLPVTPPAPSYAWGAAVFLAAIVVCGLATGLYISARLGEGPRDGLMMGVARRTGWPVRRVRTLIELAALGSGWAMGGRVGLGTLLFAFGIGPAAQWGLRLCGVDAHGGDRPWPGRSPVPSAE